MSPIYHSEYELILANQLAIMRAIMDLGGGRSWLPPQIKQTIERLELLGGKEGH